MTQRQYLQLSHTGFIIYCLFAALSIGVSQTIVILTILLTIHFLIWGKKEKALSKKDKKLLLYFYRPILFFIAMSLIAAVLGIAPKKAIFAALKTGLYLSLPFVLFYSLELTREISKQLALRRVRLYFLLLIIGQSLAAFHSIIEKALQIKIPPKIPGAVTESGQLALIIPCAIALFLTSFFQENPNAKKFISLKNPLLFQGLGIFLALTVFAWPQILCSSLDSAQVTIVQFAALGIFFLLLLIFRNKNYKHILIALLFAALLVNLKRGPWAAVFIEIFIMAIFFSRRLLVLAISSVLILFLTLAPVRERLFASSDDFLISGGRKNMWLIGLELAERFPFGLGLQNAGYMRTIDPSLPISHRHLHNNFLNILVETGSLGLVFYLWWIALFIYLGFQIWIRCYKQNGSTKKEIALLALSSSLALLGWQIAGLVEYNFGDGEVRLIAFFLMGVLLSLAKLSGVAITKWERGGEDHEKHENNETHESRLASLICMGRII